jgi:Tfp pilus assembly protein PilO
MDTKQSFLSGLSRKRYLEVLRDLPTLQRERVKEYGMLILTFFALSFFSIFAISPTLSTITDLTKQLSDNQAADSALKTKIKNLSTLQQIYTTIQPDINYVETAIPSNPNVTDLIGKIQGISKKTNVSLLALQVSDVSLYSPKHGLIKKGKTIQAPTFSFLVRVQGSQDNLLSFISSFISFDRIVTIQSLSFVTDIKQNANPTVSIQANSYFIP